MKSGNPDHWDASLQRTLQQWKVVDPLPGGFEQRVWRRIDFQQKNKPAGAWAVVQGILEDLRRPALATSYIAFLLLVGVGTGYWHARMDNARASQELGARYVHMMDPYQRR